MKKITKISLVALGGLSLLVLAGCSNSKPTTSTTAPKPVVPTSNNSTMKPATTPANQNQPTNIPLSTTKQQSANINSDLNQVQNDINSLNASDSTNLSGSDLQSAQVLK